MEKLLNKAMQNPTAGNKSKVIAYANKHMMAECGLTPVQMAILNQYRRGE